MAKRQKNPKPRELPEECWEMIVKKLPNRELESISLVSKQFHSISNNLFFDLKLVFYFPDHHLNLPRLLTRFNSIKSISFADHETYSTTRDLSLVQIACSGLKYLEKLVLKFQNSFPRVGIQKLGFMKMTSLKILCCSGLIVMNDSDLSVIATSLPWLQELTIKYGHYLSQVTDKGISELAAKLPGLICIDMSGNSLITDQSLYCLLSSCVCISEIRCSHCDRIPMKSLIGAICGYSKLKRLQCYVLDYVRTDSAGCHLRFSFGYDFTGESGNIFAMISGSNIPIKKLTFHSTYSWSKEYMSSIMQFLGNVQAIEIRYCCLRDATFCMLVENCPSLVEFEMTRTLLGTESCSLLGRKKKYGIKILKLNWNDHLSDDTMLNIALSFPDLEVLEVCDCPVVTEVGIGYFVNNCPELRELKVINNSL